MAKTYPVNCRGKYRSQGAREDWYVVRVHVVRIGRGSWGRRRRPESPGVQAPRVSQPSLVLEVVLLVFPLLLSILSDAQQSLSLSDHD